MEITQQTHQDQIRIQTFQMPKQKEIKQQKAPHTAQFVQR